jgi:hypothetical protein
VLDSLGRGAYYIDSERNKGFHSEPRRGLRRKKVTMAEKNITRAQALQFAIDNIDNDEVKDVLGKMLAQVTKPRKAAVSKARKMNENLVNKIYDLAGDEVTTKDVVAFGLPEIATTQKAAAVLRVACELGKFEKVTEGKKVAYKKVMAE